MHSNIVADLRRCFPTLRPGDIKSPSAKKVIRHIGGLDPDRSTQGAGDCRDPTSISQKGVTRVPAGARVALIERSRRFPGRECKQGEELWQSARSRHHGENVRVAFSDVPHSARSSDQHRRSRCSSGHIFCFAARHERDLRLTLIGMSSASCQTMRSPWPRSYSQLFPISEH